MDTVSKPFPSKARAISEQDRLRFSFVMKGILALKNQECTLNASEDRSAMSFQLHVALNEALYRLAPQLLAVYQYVHAHWPRDRASARIRLGEGGYNYEHFRVAASVLVGSNTATYASIGIIAGLASLRLRMPFMQVPKRNIAAIQRQCELVLDLYNVGRYLDALCPLIDGELVIAITSVLEHVAAGVISSSSCASFDRPPAGMEREFQLRGRPWQPSDRVFSTHDLQLVIDSSSSRSNMGLMVPLGDFDSLDDWANRLVVCSELLAEKSHGASQIVGFRRNDIEYACMNDPLRWCLFEMVPSHAHVLLQAIDSVTVTSMPYIPVPCSNMGLIPGDAGWNRRKHAVAAWAATLFG
jgi:hypothetical protein